MKVTLINTYDINGGAAIACTRLLQALDKKNIDVKCLVAEKHGDNPLHVQARKGAAGRRMSFARFAGERLMFSFYEKSKQVRFAYSPMFTGIDISRHKLVKNADILHLHWINFGFLSFNSLRKIFKLGKPIVWTMHDMWAFTGGCHYTDKCRKYKDQCSACPFLKGYKYYDLANKQYRTKARLYPETHISVVTCSNWLAEKVRQSSLMQFFDIRVIPNPIDTEFFAPYDKMRAKQDLKLETDKKYLLFGAANINDRRKGIKYLIEALKLLKINYPEFDLEILLFGKKKDDMEHQIPYKIHNLGSLSPKQLVEAYNAADLFVLPSLQDNLPNTVMEAMACGTPVVAFDTGGLPDLIDHIGNGYLAQYLDEKDLAAGIAWVIEQNANGELGKNARKKVLDNFSQEIVAEKYIDLYNNLINR